ncbi:hypothetical protein, partial [Pseudomonas reactans]|uniref:hypothetical protein n=1 Tax=Pseudomonas reactans TaxID=117680 RepID=UPI001C434A6D
DGAPKIKIKIKSDSLRIVDTLFVFCRSWLAGEKREAAAFCLVPRVIVKDHRRQASSYSDLRLLLPLLHTTQAGCQAAVLLLLILILGAPSNTLAGIRQGFGG